MDRQGQYLDLRARPRQPLGGWCPAQYRQGDVHHHHVRPELLHLLTGGTAVRRLAADRHPGLGVDERLEALAHNGVVIREVYA
jgi:hypothetical protein